MKATFISFGYKSDLPAPEADEVFDVRAIRNPHNVRAAAREQRARPEGAGVYRRATRTP